MAVTGASPSSKRLLEATRHAVGEQRWNRRVRTVCVVACKGPCQGREVELLRSRAAVTAREHHFTVELLYELDGRQYVTQVNIDPDTGEPDAAGAGPSGG